MTPSIWEVFRTHFRWEHSDDGSEGKTERGRFVPSPLDLSVRVGHGGQDDDAVRELAAVDERARELEQAGREN